MRAIFALLFSASLFGQDLALARLKREMASAREQEKGGNDRRPDRVSDVHAALRDWFEYRLPRNAAALVAEFPHMESSLTKAMIAGGVSKPDNPAADYDMFDPGFDAAGLQFETLPELPDFLFVTASINVPCGADEAFYAYRFDAEGRTKVIEDHFKSDGFYGSVTLQLSDPDTKGRRLLLMHRMSQQCQSTWMGMTYSVYRFSPKLPPESLLVSRHGFWFDIGREPVFVLKPAELTIEFLDMSVSGAVHNRTHLLRFEFADALTRLDPVAFQPQDFAEEWLTAPWSEMQSRSKPGTQKWHNKNRGGEYTNVVLCASRPDRWSIGLEQDYDGAKKLEVPLEVHLLVRDLGNYHYEMEAVSDSEFEGCPGHGDPSGKHPWLSVEQLKALP